jgi:hypothetical protein
MLENLKGRDHFGELGMYGRIIITVILISMYRVRDSSVV